MDVHRTVQTLREWLPVPRCVRGVGQQHAVQNECRTLVPSEISTEPASARKLGPELTCRTRFILHHLFRNSVAGLFFPNCQAGARPQVLDSWRFHSVSRGGIFPFPRFPRALVPMLLSLAQPPWNISMLTRVGVLYSRICHTRAIFMDVITWPNASSGMSSGACAIVLTSLLRALCTFSPREYF